MSAFRRVEPQLAGPRALGILVPPGPRTLVILRPRSLAWDLLPAQWDGDPARAPAFCTFERDEAAQMARQVARVLADTAGRGVNPVETVGDALGRAFQVWLRAAELRWIVCRRVAGQEYAPLVLASQEEARRIGEALTPVVWPTSGAEQEYYFNTQKFQ